MPNRTKGESRKRQFRRAVQAPGVQRPKSAPLGGSEGTFKSNPKLYKAHSNLTQSYVAKPRLKEANSNQLADTQIWLTLEIPKPTASNVYISILFEKGTRQIRSGKRQKEKTTF